VEPGNIIAAEDDFAVASISLQEAFDSELGILRETLCLVYNNCCFLHEC
jgi:hypothetical protein